MNSEKDLMQTENSTVETPEMNDRREALKKLGKFSAYVAPFTVLALSQKAQAASGHGPGPSARSAGGAHR
jgi:hypothetical protein